MPRAVLRYLGLALPCAFAIVAACTVFDGLEAQQPGSDASTTDSPPPPPPVDNYVPGQDVVVPPDSAPPAVAYLSRTDAAKVCSLVQSCSLLAQSLIPSTGVPIDPVNYAACVDWLAGPIPPNRVGFNIQQAMFQCVAGQTTCQGAGSCLSLEDIAPGDPRCQLDADVPDADGYCADDGGTVVRCKDGVALHCGNAYYVSGSHCLEGLGDNTYWCATQFQNPCTQSNSCLGGLFEYCGTDDLIEGVNCPTTGYNGCGVDDAGFTNCATNSVVSYCSAAGATDCSGNTLQVCDGVELSPYDCTALNATCSNKGQAALCTQASDTCTPYDATMNQCTGTSISLCIGGQPASFDCSSIGKQCVASGGAAHCG
jgi:hypothetical protein